MKYPRSCRAFQRTQSTCENGDDRRIHASITKGQRLDPVATNKIAQMTAGNNRFLATNRVAVPLSPKGKRKVSIRTFGRNGLASDNQDKITIAQRRATVNRQ